MKEIERKFLVISDSYKNNPLSKTHIKQGYLSKDPERTVRVRIIGNKGYLTIKGKSMFGGIERFEWEKEIDIVEANALFDLCLPGTIEKYRYEIDFKSQIFEVDEFLGRLSGLVLAELELENIHQKFEVPIWIGKEVTGISKYYNSNL